VAAARTAPARGAFARNLLAALALLASVGAAQAAGGPLGIDHRLSYDDSGVWSRGKQLALVDALIAGEIGLGLWQGGDSRLGRTDWHAIDASILSGAAAQVLKYAFRRSRPYESNNPDDWFRHGAHYSFPSGEVTAVAAIVTPFILEYSEDRPAVWALAVLPVYDAVARMKAQAHWQTDVLAGAALGVWSGSYAMRRDRSFTLSVLPGWVGAGWKRDF